MRARSFASVIACGCSLFACAAAPPPLAATARTEIVIDEPEVVRAHATAAPAGSLPPLPVALERTSPAFQQAFAAAQPLLAAPAPAGAPDDGAAYRAWLDTDFKPWLSARGQAVAQATAALGAVATGPAVDERVVGGALVGLMDAHVHDQLVAVPAPPELRADAKLLRIYRNEINAAAASWLEQALISLRDCASHAARQVDPAFGPWLALCQDHMATVQQAQADATALADSVAREREADRVAAEGARPPGPDACWTPPTGAEQPGASATPLAAQTATRPALSPRDLRYGARDATTGVRVSAVLADSAATAATTDSVAPAIDAPPRSAGAAPRLDAPPRSAGAAPRLDASPLLATDLQQRLAHCFAQHVREDAAITVAVHANVSVRANGRIAGVTLGPELAAGGDAPGAGADAPSKPLLRCMQQALAQSAFDANPAGGVVQWNATYCLRRD